MVRSPTGLAPSPFLPVKAYRVVRLVCAKGVLVMSSVRQAVKIIPAVGRLALLQDRNVEKRARRKRNCPGRCIRNLLELKAGRGFRCVWNLLTALRAVKAILSE